jgi:putative ABC transport system permease protein
VNIPSFRAAARIAWRQARRSAWRSALVLAMMALPISALTLAAIVIQTGEPTADESAAASMGQAEIQIDGYTGDTPPPPARLLRSLPPGSRLITVTYEGNEQLIAGSLVYLNLQEPSVPASDTAMRGLYQMVAGRAPRARDEIALSPDMMKQLKARTGSRLTLHGLDRPVLVTGVVVAPESIDSLQGVTGPGTMGGHSKTVGSGNNSSTFHLERT